LEKALLRIRRECMSAKPQPAADLGNWKAEAEANAEKGLLTMAAMGVFLFLEEREPLTLAYMCS